MNTYIQNTVFLSPSPGPSGVGVNELKRRLLLSDPDHYGVTVPRKIDFQKCHLYLPRTKWFLILNSCLKPLVSFLSDTTREKKRQENEGVDYNFVSIPMFEEDILNQRYMSRCFLSHGSKNGPLS